MPSKSSKQHRAMEAAAHGHSRLGIPPKVAKEFVAADAAGGKKFAGKNGKRGIGAAIGRSLGHGRKG